MKNNPWLSVLMPTRNGEEFLRASLESIASQGDPGIECLIVDDASTDSTLSIIEDFTERLPLAVRRHREAGNWVRGTNEALEMARGEYISLLHQDDIWYGGRARQLRRLASAHPTAGLFLTAARFIDGKGRDVGPWKCPLPVRAGSLDRSLLMSRLLVQNFVALPAPMVRRQTALEVGGLDESAWYTADWDFWLKLAAHSETTYDSTSLVGFRLHKLSQTYVRSASPQEFRTQHAAIANRHLSTAPMPAADKDRIRRRSEFSIEVNATLAEALHGSRKHLWNLLARFMTLGPRAQHAYLRDSRIVERVVARLRASLL